MRYTALLLIALSGACKYDKLTSLGTWENPFKAPYIELTTVTVSPTAVRAGDQFVASASATFRNCHEADIVVTYGGRVVTQFASAFQSSQSSFTAILNQTVVTFRADCPTPTGTIVTPNQYIHMTVAPAP